MIDASDCHQDDNVAIEDDKMLFAGLSVSELTSVDHVEDGIAANSMSNLFPEQKIVTEPSVSEVNLIKHQLIKILFDSIINTKCRFSFLQNIISNSNTISEE